MPGTLLPVRAPSEEVGPAGPEGQWTGESFLSDGPPEDPGPGDHPLHRCPCPGQVAEVRRGPPEERPGTGRRDRRGGGTSEPEESDGGQESRVGAEGTE